MIKQIRTSQTNFGYIIAGQDSGECVVIDPSPNPEPILEEVEANNLEVIYLINTHDHFDHTGGNKEVLARTEAQLVMHSSANKGDLQVEDGEKISFGQWDLLILHTPGHTGDSICLLYKDNLITGDTLFVSKVGGTKGEEGARKQFDSLRRLMELEDQVKVWPGHDYGPEKSSTIGKERETNPFCQRLDNFEDFLYLKKHWDEYKKNNL